MLVRVCCGEPRRVGARCACRVWRPKRRAIVSRERTALTQEQTRLRNQIAQLAGDVRLPRVDATRQRRVVDGACGIGRTRRCRCRCRSGLPAPMSGWRWSAAQLAAIEAAQLAATRPRLPASALARLVQLKGIATTSASVLLDEGLVWRAFRNRRQLGGLLGFAPAKSDSGASSRDQGISRAGNKRLQSVMVQLAWGWVHWQPPERADAVVSGALWAGQTRAQSRHCRARAQIVHRALALCDRRRAPSGRGAEERA